MPVKNLNMSKLNNDCPSSIIKALKIASHMAERKNTLDGENRSATLKIANTKVPQIIQTAQQI